MPQYTRAVIMVLKEKKTDFSIFSKILLLKCQKNIYLHQNIREN